MRRILALLALVACSKAEPEKPAGPPPMSQAERQRGTTLCQKYVERVCACAEKDPSLREACELGRGQPEAVRMHLDVLEGAPLADVSPTGQVSDGAAKKRPPLNDNERRLTEDSLRKVVAACVKLDAELDPARCPRR